MSFQADLNVMPFCSQFIPMDVINHPQHGSIIYHPSILPRHRGASAINWSATVGGVVVGMCLVRRERGREGLEGVSGPGLDPVMEQFDYELFGVFFVSMIFSFLNQQYIHCNWFYVHLYFVRTLMEGDEKAGFSIFWADDGLDTGPVLLQKETSVDINDTVDSLYNRFLYPEGIRAMVGVKRKAFSY